MLSRYLTSLTSTWTQMLLGAYAWFHACQNVLNAKLASFPVPVVILFFPSSGPLCCCDWHHETLEAAVSSPYPTCQSTAEQNIGSIKHKSAAAIWFFSLFLYLTALDAMRSENSVWEGYEWWEIPFGWTSCHCYLCLKQHRGIVQVDNGTYYTFFSRLGCTSYC